MKKPRKSRQNCLGVVFLPVFPSGGYRTYSNLDPLGGGESLNYVYPVEWSACTPLFTLHFMYVLTNFSVLLTFEDVVLDQVDVWGSDPRDPRCRRYRRD